MQIHSVKQPTAELAKIRVPGTPYFIVNEFILQFVEEVVFVGIIRRMKGKLNTGDHFCILVASVVLTSKPNWTSNERNHDVLLKVVPSVKPV